MAQRTALLNIVGLTPSLLCDATPTLVEFARRCGGIHILTATTKSIDWSMARKNAPSLVTVLAMLVDDGSANANATGGENILMVSCSPTYAECFAEARASCHPMKTQAVYSCSAAGDVLCSFTCVSVGPGVQ